MTGLARLLRPLRRERRVRTVVLPFAPVGDAFARGFTEELIGLLTRNARLDVVGRVSAYALEGDVDRRAEERAMEDLGAELVVTGSVLREDVTLDVAVAVTGPMSGTVRSERWSRPLDETFAVLGECAAWIAGRGRGAHRPVEPLLYREPTSDFEAWRLYLEGRALVDARAGARETVAAFEGALERDELFAGAALGIAAAYRTARERHASTGVADPLAAVSDAAHRALELDETLPGAHVALAYAHLESWRLAEAEQSARRALELAPGSPEAHAMLARVLVCRRDLDAACEAADRAASLEPLHPDVVNESGLPHALSGRLETAVDRSRRVVHLDPEHVMAYVHLGRYAARSGRHGESVTYHRAAAELSGRAPFLTAYLGLALLEHGDRPEAEEIARDLARKAERGSPVATCLGVLLLRLGRVDAGLEWLERALSAREMTLLLLDTAWLPLPEALRTPRLDALLGARPR